MIANRMIDRYEAWTGEDLSYAREMSRVAPAAFWKLFLSPMMHHRGDVPKDLLHLAKLGAVQVEDCGPCVQTGVNLMKQDGVPTELIRAALDGGAELPQLQCDAYFFGRGVAGDGFIDDELRERLIEAVGKRGLIELTLAAASVRIFPALKRGLGYARSCTNVELVA
jgi:hypothetical protein